jgi:tryptophan synthase alpha chain
VNRIDRAFARARSEERAALALFVTAGDPDLATTGRLLPALAEAGTDLIEIGIPHSDPIAEGPTIQASSQRALERGTGLPQILELCREARRETDVALLLMGYWNNVLGHGVERLVQDCAAIGIDGLIVTDAPYEEAPELGAACEAKGVHRVLMVAPTSTPERVVQISARSRGFVYCVSVTGVTGERAVLPGDLRELVARVKRATRTPVGVGFGIATPEHAAEVGRIADGVIVGSALVKRIAEAPTGQAALAAAERFTRELASALRRSPRP